MNHRGPFSDRALLALAAAAPRSLTDQQLARAMQLVNPTSIMAELDQRQLVRSAVHDRTTRPWTWSYTLTDAGRTAAQAAVTARDAERAAIERRLLEADDPYQAKSVRGHYGEGHDGKGRRP